MKNKKLSINIIGKVPPPIGGVTIHTLRLYQWLKKEKDINVKLTALNKHNIDDENIKYSGNFIIWVFKKLLFGFKEDIVHYQGSNYTGLLLLSIIKKLHPNFNFVWSIHSEYLINKIKDKKLFVFSINQINNIIADNINIKNQLILEKYKSDNISIISPFLMPENYNKNTDNLLDIYKNNNKVILFNAYKLVFNDKKEDVYGLDTLLKAFQNINDKNNILILLIPSINNEEKEYYNNLINNINLELQKNIILISDVKTDGWKYINSCDIFIRPTITDGDALSVKEALYMDKITIVSDCTTRPDGVVLFRSSSSGDLTIKLNEIVNDDVKEHVNLNKEDNIKKFINLYIKLKENNENTIS
jgi:hypothetical protein